MRLQYDNSAPNEYIQPQLNYWFIYEGKIMLQSKYSREKKKAQWFNFQCQMIILSVITVLSVLACEN